MYKYNNIVTTKYSESNLENQNEEQIACSKYSGHRKLE